MTSSGQFSLRGRTVCIRDAAVHRLVHVDGRTAQRNLAEGVDVVVLVLRQPPAEDGIGLVLCEGCVLLVELLVAVVVDRVIRFFAAMPVGRIMPWYAGKHPCGLS